MPPPEHTSPAGLPNAILALQASVRKLEARCEALEAAHREACVREAEVRAAAETLHGQATALQATVASHHEALNVWQTWWERYGEEMSGYIYARFWQVEELASWRRWSYQERRRRRQAEGDADMPNAAAEREDAAG